MGIYSHVIVTRVADALKWFEENGDPVADGGLRSWCYGNRRTFSRITVTVSGI